jgi:hypothetical protein
MKRKYGTIVGLTTISLALLAAGGGAHALPTTGQAATDVPQVIEYHGDAPDGKVVQLPTDESTISKEMNSALVELEYSNIGSAINSVSWSAGSGTYTVYAHGNQRALSKRISEILPAESWDLQEAKFSKAELLAESDRILEERDSVTLTGMITQIGPKYDGSGLNLGVSAGDSSRGVAADESTVESEYPVDVFQREPIAPTSSPLADASPYKAGAVIKSTQSDGVHSCTSAFIIGTTQTPEPVKSMLTADHCSGNGWKWTSGLYGNISATNAVLGYAEGQVQGGLDIERISSNGNPIPYAAMVPYVYVGNITQQNAYAAVLGYTATPVVGAGVCLSGAFSGRVCNNIVTAVDQTFCESLFVCYNGQTSVQNPNGIAIAGNGDSGGPVITNIGGGAYATGIISAIESSGMDATCVGMPDSPTRKCAYGATFTPMSKFFQQNGGYALYIVPGAPV